MTWRERGAQAQRDGYIFAPLADPAVLEAVRDLPVGAGAADIMREWNAGYTAALLAEPIA